MSHDLIFALIGILEEQSRSFDQMRSAMAKARGAFTSIGARRLQAGIENLEERSLKLLDLESKRSKVVDQLQRALGNDGALRVSDIKPGLPVGLARTLQHAADTAAKAAQQLRVECQVGTRLLRLSEDANAGIIEALLGLSHDSSAFYDSNARWKSADTPGGSLISGTA
jgi:hypothetical protein